MDSMNNENQQKIEYDNAIQAFKDFGDAFTKLDAIHRERLFKESLAIAKLKRYINTPDEISNIIKILKQVEKNINKRHT